MSLVGEAELSSTGLSGGADVVQLDSAADQREGYRCAQPIEHCVGRRAVLL